GQGPFQALTAEQHHETMALASLNDHLRTPHFPDLLREQRAQLFAHLGVNAPGAAVGDNTFRIERAEVGARRYVSRLELETEPQRFNDAAAHLELEGVVAK